MAPKLSAGILLYRLRDGQVEVLLIHPGGPLWANKDEAAWSVPKGEYEPGEDPLTAAVREFREETGFDLEGPYAPLHPVKQGSGKVLSVWAVRGDADASAMRSNTFTLEWPPKSGRYREFPEADRAAWFDLAMARLKLLPGQRPLLDQLEHLLERRS